MTLNTLDNLNLTLYVLEEIYDLARHKNFARIHDKRSAIFGLSTILEIPFDSLTESIKSRIKDIVVLIMQLTRDSVVQRHTPEEDEEEEDEEEDLNNEEIKKLVSSAKDALPFEISENVPDNEDVDSEDGIDYDQAISYFIRKEIEDELLVDDYEPGELPTDNIKETTYFLEHFQQFLTHNNLEDEIRQMFSEEDMKLYDSIVELSKMD